MNAREFKDEVIAFTDGSFIKKKAISGGERIYCGYGIYFPNRELPNVSRPFKRGKRSNQRAELFAIYVALILIKKNFAYNRVKIYTDSEYSIKSLTKWVKVWEVNGWKTSNGKPVENLDIIIPTYDILKKQNGKVEFIHVRSHSKNQDEISISNNIVDSLAKKGALSI
jgi:ribonuclease HI